MKNFKNISNVKYFLLLHLLFFFYTFTTICSKAAGREPLLSTKFIVLYFILLGILGIYAVAWQQIIKKIPLTVACSNKAVTIIWGQVLGVVFFQETVNLYQILGMGIVLLGVIIYTTDKSDNRAEGELI